MIFSNRINVIRKLLFTISLVLSFFAFGSPYTPENAMLPIQAGLYFSSQSNDNQFININGLIGDKFNTTNTNNQNGLFGIGYYMHGFDFDPLTLFYGVNAYYLAPVTIRGTIEQERLYTNLAYSYSFANYPIYLAAKALINNSNPRYNMTLDFGLGPNIVNTDYVHETSLDNGMTIPDQIFTGKTTTVFSASAGIGMRFNNVLGTLPFECGYRFFYLGHGSFAPLTDQTLNNLTTGDNYANAIICSVNI